MEAETQDYRVYLEELDNMAHVLSKLPVRTGLVPKFIFPGVIGVVQEGIIMRRIKRESQKAIYKDLNYYECGYEIIDLTESLCQIRCNSVEPIDRSLKHPANIEIYRSVANAIATWHRVYPEIAQWQDQEYNMFIKTSALRIINTRTNHALCGIMDLQKVELNPPKMTILLRLKALGYYYFNMIFNLIVFALIIGLIYAIFYILRSNLLFL